MKNFTSGLVAVIIVLVAGMQVQAQKIATIAGNGHEGYSGDKGTATNAMLHWPQGLAMDKIGRLYIADALNNRVRRIDIAGNITTIAGTGFQAGTGGGGYNGDGIAATAADLFNPTGVAVDTAGNVYIADSKNHCIRIVDTGGKINTFAGTPTVGGFGGDGATATGAKLNEPTRVAVDTFGNVYITDVQNNRIRKVKAGVITTFAGTGVPTYTGDGAQASAATIFNPADVVADKLGNVYIADELNNCVRKVDNAGIITTYAGTGIPAFTGDSSAATAARMYDPSGLAVDDSANLYISDRGNECIRMVVRTTGIIYTVAGTADSAGYKGDGGPATAAWFSYPQGLVVNHKGSIYVADMHNNVIRFVAYKAEGVNTVNSVNADINIYPNPASGEFVVNMTSELNEQALVTIGNIAGQKVYQSTMYTNKPKTIQLNSPPGMYILYAATDHGIWSQRVVIQ
ncbi:MAG: repeat containing protein [Flavipsychrobacter sp.]|nr:repeat containing protein [Flavipsychrobacter sp.]